MLALMRKQKQNVPKLKMAQITQKQKQLEQLHRQLYGKGQQTATSQVSSAIERTKIGISFSANLMSKANATLVLPSQDIKYLKNDLIKISFLSFLALGVQFALYFATANNIIKLHF